MAHGITWRGAYCIVSDPRAWPSFFSALRAAGEKEEEGTEKGPGEGGHSRDVGGWNVGVIPSPTMYFWNCCCFEPPESSVLRELHLFGSILKNYFIHHKLIHHNVIQRRCNPTALNRVIPGIALAHQCNCCRLSGLRNQVNWRFTA